MTKSSLDSEGARVHAFPELRRRETGAYFTPGPIARLLVAEASHCVPEGPLRVVDPACGAGAVLSAAQEHFRSATLLGVELSNDVADACRRRLPGARIFSGDALRGAAHEAVGEPHAGFELWIGNPPYNGTSPLLQDKQAYVSIRSLLPCELKLPRGTSLRDDFAFFLMLAARRLEHQRGAIAFITPSSWLDSYLYAPLREHLLKHLALESVVDLGPGVFANTRVRTCITVWSTHLPRPTVRFVTGDAESTFRPTAPEFRLRPVPAEAVALDARWRTGGALLTDLVPLHFSGLKTRFDELLTDDDPQRLLRRVDAFFTAPSHAMKAFALEHAIPQACLEKLRSLKASLPSGLRAERTKVRRFFRYAGARHRAGIPESAKAWCYLDRRLIPRGDHRLQGHYDPHASDLKLVFNLRELPLTATVVNEAGCVHDHRHARFAPLLVPQRVRTEGLTAARTGGALGAPVLNLSPQGRQWAEALGGGAALFAELARFINSRAVQVVWAPAFGTTSILPIPDLRKLSESDS